MDKPNISLIPDVLYQIGPFHITTGHVTMLLITSTIAILCLYIAANSKLKPTRLQIALEEILMWFYEKVEFAFENKKIVKRIFPLVMTMFLIIVSANLFSIVPLLESITIGETPLFRTPTSDVSMTLSLGLFAVILSHIMALSKAPFRHIGNYIKVAGFFKIRHLKDIGPALLEFVLGFTDIIGEFAKIVSISFRLFGNIFSGVAVAAVFAFLAPYLVPIPFFGLGMFSGVIQAIVFTLLVITYLSGPIGALNSEE